MASRIRLGISTCPNDTFAFHGLLTRSVDWQGLDFDVRLLDIEQLNQGLFGGAFDVAKASFHAALHLADSMLVLPSGSALGFGVGPLLLAAHADTTPSAAADTVLCPGAFTTATLLYRMFYAGLGTIKQVVFSDIMPTLMTGTADFGVCIHEGRFTYADHGLSLVEDLGKRWEQVTACPLPLGGILAARRIPAATLAKVHAVIRASIELALANPEIALPTMRLHAQEMTDDVLQQHVDLYVNEWTIDLALTGGWPWTSCSVERWRSAWSQQVLRGWKYSTSNQGVALVRST